MYLYLLGFLAIVSIYNHSYISHKYNQFTSLNQLVKSRYKNVFMIMYISCVIIAKMYWLRFLQWLNNSIVPIGKDKFTLSYVINNKTYTILIHKRKGPSRVMIVYDEQTNDVTELIAPYLGPNEDFHQDKFTPAFWHRDKLIFEIADGTRLTFDRDDIISV